MEENYTNEGEALEDSVEPEVLSEPVESGQRSHLTTVFATVAIVAILALLSFVLWQSMRDSAPPAAPDPDPPPQADRILTDEEKQLQRLSELRSAANSEPLTEEEKAAQLEELSQLRQESQSQDDDADAASVEAQLQELSDLRNNQ